MKKLLTLALAALMCIFAIAAMADTVSIDRTLELQFVPSKDADVIITGTKNLPELLKGHKSFVRLSGLKRSNLVNLFYINALDMMYIWMRQPQAVTAMRELMERATPEERGVFLKTQEILYREKSITKLFLNGLVGSNFSRALAFYLHYYRHYLEELRQFDPQPEKAEDAADWKGFTAVIGPEDGEGS